MWYNTGAMENSPYEIERKFLIRYPDAEMLSRLAEDTRITQTYLLAEGEGDTARVRKRGKDGSYVYTHTVKTHINDLRRVEMEREISLTEYEELLKTADPQRRVIEKTRWVLPYQGKCFEIDLFPFWNDRAYMEVELEDESEEVRLPPQIEIIREVTGDRRYSNAALSLEIPFDEI